MKIKASQYGGYLIFTVLGLQQGDSVIVQESNGCGKSILIKLLNGIIFPSEGEYLYKGHAITHNRHLAELLGTRFALMNEDHELNMI